MNRLIIILLLLCSNILWCQNNTQCSANIKASLIKGLSAQLIKANLDFGETILDGNVTVVNKDPEKGVNIKISGDPQKNVILNYSQVSLTCEACNLNFTPDVRHTYADPVYTDPVSVSNGSYLHLNSNNGEGVVFLWIGGDIKINKDQPAGDYSGSFLVTVSY
jgi:hypothetical protein